LWQPRTNPAELRIWRNLGRQLSECEHGASDQGAAFVFRQLLWRPAILLHRQVSPDPSWNRKKAADAPCHSRLLLAGEGLRLSIHLPRSLYALEPDRRNVHREFSNPEYSQSADGAQQRVRRNQF